jgi:hypothetical protein
MPLIRGMPQHSLATTAKFSLLELWHALLANRLDLMEPSPWSNSSLMLTDSQDRMVFRAVAALLVFLCVGWGTLDLALIDYQAAI